MREAGQRRNPAALSEVECVLFFMPVKVILEMHIALGILI